MSKNWNTNCPGYEGPISEDCYISDCPTNHEECSTLIGIVDEARKIKPEEVKIGSITLADLRKYRDLIIK